MPDALKLIAQVLQRPALLHTAAGAPSRGAQGHGWDAGQPNLVPDAAASSPACSRGWNREVPSQPNHAVILLILSSTLA